MNTIRKSISLWLLSLMLLVGLPLRATSPDCESLLGEASEALYFDDDANKALQLLKKALDKCGDDYRIYNELGNVYKNLGMTAEAAAAYTEAALLDTNISPDAFLCAVTVLEENGMNREALPIYEEALKRYYDHDEYWSKMDGLYARYFNNLVSDNKDKEALDATLSHLAALQRKGFPETADYTLKLIGDVVTLSHSLGMRSLLLEYGVKIAQAVEKIPVDQRHTSLTAIALIRPAAEYYTAIGEYAKADTLYQSMMKVNSTPKHMAAFQTAYAVFLGDTGRAREAYDLWDSSASLYMKAHDPAAATISLLQKVYNAKHLQDEPTMVAALDKIKMLLLAVYSDPKVSEESRFIVDLNIAHLLIDIGEYDDAVKAFEEALPFAMEHSDLAKTTEILNALGLIAIRQGDYHKALHRLDGALEASDPDPDMLQAILSNKAYALNRLGRTTEAVTIYRMLLENMREQMQHDFVYMTDAERHEFWRQQNFLFFNINDLDKDQPNVGELRYEAALINKGILLDASARLRRLILTSGDEVLIADFKRLQQLKERQNSAEDLAEIRRLERNLQERVKRFGNFTAGSTATLKQVSSQLSTNDRAIEIVRRSEADDSEYDALIADLSGNVKIISLPSQKELYTLTDKEIYTSPHLLADKFWTPILNHCPDGGRIFISPDGDYHKIAFEHLPSEEGPMSHVRKIYRVSSTRNLTGLGNTPVGEISLWGGLDYNSTEDDEDDDDAYEDYDIAGDMRGGTVRLGETAAPWLFLPGTLREVENINEVAATGDRTVSMTTRGEGSEGAFKRLSGSEAPILHVATHGFYLPAPGAVSSDMLRSGLVLSGANNAWGPGYMLTDATDDGIITATEISRLDLSKTNLVVLSACGSGLGDVEAEGVFGLPRAFKQSGVGSIVMTLWPVDDKVTEKIMTEFYRGVVAGLPLRDALDKACRSQGDIAPELWAAFVVLD